MADHKELFVKYRTAVEEAKGHESSCRCGPCRRVRAIESQVVSENYGLIQKLVGKLIRRLANGFTGEEADLMQAGAIGFVTAWKRWDPSKGTLSTYAGHWVRHEVQEALGEDQAIYQPRQTGKTWPIHRTQMAFRARMGREATAAELISELQLDHDEDSTAPTGEDWALLYMAKVVGLKERDWPKPDADPVEKQAFRDIVEKLTAERIEEWRMSPTVESIDAWADDSAHNNITGTSSPCYDKRSQAALEDRKPNPEQALEHAQISALIQEGFETLTRVEQYVVQQLFMEDTPYRVVANALGVSVEWVRQHRNNAIQKLREAAGL